MATAYQRIKNQAEAIKTIFNDVIPRVGPAVDGIRDEIHSLDGLAANTPAVAGGRSKGSISDPTYRAATEHLAGRRARLVEELVDLAGVLQTLTVSLDMIRGFEDRYAPRIIPQQIPQCRQPQCETEVATYTLANGKKQPRSDGLCDKHRMQELRGRRKHQAS